MAYLYFYNKNNINEILVSRDKNGMPAIIEVIITKYFSQISTRDQTTDPESSEAIELNQCKSRQTETPVPTHITVQFQKQR